MLNESPQSSGDGARPAEGWLAAVVPAGAHRFRAADPLLRQALDAAGAELTESEPDVEIASPGAILGDAPIAVATLLATAQDRSLPIRALARVGNALRVLVRAAKARWALRGRGYTRVEVLRWDFGETLRAPGLAVEHYRRRPAEYLPRQALAVAWRGERPQTVLEAVLEAAGRESGALLRPRWASARAGILVVVTDSGVLRVAIGPGRTQLENQRATLEGLRKVDLPSGVLDRIPWLLVSGRTGLADWSLERLLPGTRPARLRGRLLEECIEFLVGLHSAGGGSVGLTLHESVETLSTVCTREASAVVRALAQRLERQLAGVPSGFGHGDFFAGNLLADSDHLTGVLDWDAGGPGRAPLVDLLHLQLTRMGYGSDDNWGPTLVHRLLPAVRSDAAARRYCRARGLDDDPGLREALTLVYWLEYVAYQLRTHVSRCADPRWLQHNIEYVLRRVAHYAESASTY